MKNAMFCFAALALLAAAGCSQDPTHRPVCIAQSQAAPIGVPAGTYPLFIIERSKNANTVHYDAQLTADGELDPAEPVIAYYIMLAEDGRRKPLNLIETLLAYGFNIKSDPSTGGYRMTMVAAPQRSIAVTKAGSGVRAELIIDGQPAIIEKMYINASDGLPWPTVHYLELYGRDLQTGEKRYEKILPK